VHLVLPFGSKTPSSASLPGGGTSLCNKENARFNLINPGYAFAEGGAAIVLFKSTDITTDIADSAAAPANIIV
jgi:hypothetical protein